MDADNCVVKAEGRAGLGGRGQWRGEGKENICNTFNNCFNMVSSVWGKTSLSKLM